ncbi:hypothetical protein N7462_002586 [Penicillium macrosclerotiorum]|uniref:uncharacterized protein n=1 Tax=Penicillium macrosclerotiorum TaxID=303699 RepID=UPI0025492251|nr:uncharacterized protein N7462_002586 [Penicillium macrosclerotiorum]KAJ5693163.1 hypothetical protein N7462_002586 [Penicillium macrosclerotiorum]
MLGRALAVLCALVVAAEAHSWVEQLMVIAKNGTFVGSPGYPRGFYPRSKAGYSDLTMEYLIPPDGTSDVTKIADGTKLCRTEQQTQDQTDGYPRLQASSGAMVALRYQENGHVTLPMNQKGKRPVWWPDSRGTVYVYATTSPSASETFQTVNGTWPIDGSEGTEGWTTSGDLSKGRLIAMHNFDDKRCYQINSGDISLQRQQSFAHTANQLMGADMWCQIDVELPSEVTSGKTVTLYWVWDWRTWPQEQATDYDTTYPDGKMEVYTTCMDIDIVSDLEDETSSATEYIAGQDLNNAAISSEMANPTAMGGIVGARGVAATVTEQSTETFCVEQKTLTNTITSGTKTSTTVVTTTTQWPLPTDGTC